MNQNLDNIIAEHNSDAALLEEMVFEQIKLALPKLQERDSSVDWQEIAALLRNAPDLIEREGLSALQDKLKKPDGSPDTKKIDAFGHLHNVMLTVRSYTPVLTSRAEQTESHTAFENLRQAIITMKEAGYNLEEAAKFFDEIKISKSGTSHPTETLCPEGIALCHGLVKAAEGNDAFERNSQITDVVRSMILAENFAAHKKATILEETDSSDNPARMHNEGANMVERFIEDTLFDVYGEKPKKRFWPDTAPRSWDYDSDGKNNAEGWAMLTKMSGTTLHMVEDALAYFELAKQKDPSIEQNENFRSLREDFTKLRHNLRPIYGRAREITARIADETDPEKRMEHYKNHYLELREISDHFRTAYDFTDAEGRGFNFFKQTVDKLALLKDSTQDPDAALDIDEVHRTIRRNGFALEKGQTRQNDIVHTRIIDNLINLPQFRARGILSAGILADIDRKGAFSKLDSTDLQSKIMQDILEFCKENGNRKDVLDDLFMANPLAFDKGGNGYPRQERTLLDRFKLRSLYPLKFDQGIISDSGEIAGTHQMFIADMFGMGKLMRHMMLHEDRLTLSRQAKLLATFSRYGGGEGVDRRRKLTTKDANWDWYLKGRDVHDLSLMRPCSDAERGGGWATRLEAFQSFRDNTRQSYETRRAFEMMLGGGMSMGRFGGDVGIPRRVIERELKKISIERGKPLSHTDKIERRLMRSALAMLYTEQGRAKRYYTATPAQVADDFAGRVTEMIYGRLDLEGRVPDYQYILKPTPMSAHMLELTANLRDRAIDEFAQFRFATDGKSDPKSSKSIVLNKLARQVTAPNIISYMNNGARPGSKSGSQEMTEVRAIENNERDYLSQMHMGGYYSAGNFMRSLWQKMHDSKSPVELEDIQNLMNDPEWDYNLFTKCLTDAGRADFSHALEKTGWKDATFDKLVAVGKSVRLVKNEGHDNYHMRYDTKSGVTQEQAYIAKAFYDRLLFMSLTEAALNTSNKKKPTLRSNLGDIIESFRPADNAPCADLGPLTKERYKASVEIIAEHNRNKAGYAIEYMLEDHIAARVKAGEDKNKVIEELGGERFMRRAASAYRAGTVPHWPLWSGAVNYGMPNIQKHDLGAKPGLVASTHQPGPPA